MTNGYMNSDDDDGYFAYQASSSSPPWLAKFTIGYVIFVCLAAGPIIYVGRKVRKYFLSRARRRRVADGGPEHQSSSKRLREKQAREAAAAAGTYYEMTEVVRTGRHNIIVSGEAEIDVQGDSAPMTTVSRPISGPSDVPTARPETQYNVIDINYHGGGVLVRSRHRRAIMEQALKKASETVSSLPGGLEEADAEEGGETCLDCTCLDSSTLGVLCAIDACMGNDDDDHSDDEDGILDRAGHLHLKWGADSNALVEGNGAESADAKDLAKAIASKDKSASRYIEDNGDEIEGLFEGAEWAYLPPHVKEAAKILGYSRRQWDIGGAVEADKKLWDHLTDREKEAATALGYNKQFWDRKAYAMDRSTYVTRGRTTLLGVLSYDRESKRILRLAIPLSSQSTIEALLEAVMTAIISQYLGSDALAAYALCTVLLSLADGLFSGLDEAEEILIAQALGMDNYLLAGQYVQLTTIIYFIGAIPLYTLWVFLIDNITLTMGLGEGTAQMARVYVATKAISHLIASGVSDTLGGLLRCDGKARTVATIDIAFNIISMALAAVAVIVDGRGLGIIGFIHLATSICYAMFMSLLCLRNGWLDPYREGIFHHSAVSDWKLVRSVLKFAGPLSLGSVLSELEWGVLLLSAGHISPEAIAAWSVFGAIWSVFECAPGGISSAAIFRISFHLGNANPRMAKIAAYKSLLYVALLAFGVTVLFLSNSEAIIRIFTRNEKLAAMLEASVYLLAIGNVLMCVGSCAWNIVNAQSRTRLATVIYLLVVWCVTTPLSPVYIFALGYGIDSLASAIVVGYATMALVLMGVVFTTNWTKESMRIIAKSGAALPRAGVLS